MQKWSLESFLEYLENDYSTIGPESIQINNIAPIDKGTSSDISFCSSEGSDGMASILSSRCGIILCKKSLKDHIQRGIDRFNDLSRLYIFVNNPRLVFIRIAKAIKGSHELRNGVSKNAIISDSAKIGNNCFIGDYTIMGEDCVIGDNSIIESGVVIKNAIIGNNCIAQSGSVIGETGFAFERSKDLSLEIFPHFGRVIIRNNVEVFANCSIARGSISDTIIGEGTKIDALCQIAHNVHIGKNSQLTAGTVIGGSTQIGDNCWLGLNSTVKNKLKIGNNVIVGSGSSVIRDVEDKDIVAGVPAKSIKDKISISEDKLFLMGGQSDEGKNQQTHHKLARKIGFNHYKGLTLTGWVLSGSLYVLLSI